MPDYKPLGLRTKTAGGSLTGLIAKPPSVVIGDEPVPDVGPILPKNQGAFLSALQWIGRPGQVVKNALTGNFEGAARQAGDFLGEAADAVLPGDLIPQLSRPEDEVSGASLLGITPEWQKEHPLLSLAASLPVDIATDPLTFTGFAPLAKAAGAAGKVGAAAVSKVPGGAAALEGLSKGVSKAGMGLRSIAGAQRLSPEARSVLEASSAARTGEAKAGMEAIRGSQALSGLTPDEANVVGDVLDNFKWEGTRLAGELVPGSTSALERVAAHPGVTPENQAKITQAVQDAIAIGQNQAKRPGIFSPEGLPKEYLARGYKGQTPEQAIDEVLGTGPAQMGQPGAAKARTLEGAADVAGFLEKNPGVQYERNALERLATRAQAQGGLAGRAEIGRKLLGDAFELTDDAQRGQVTEKIREMAATDPESAKVLHDAFHGLAPRGPILGALNKVNRVVKPILVYGFVLPKIGSIIRNKTGGIWQAFSNPASRDVAAKSLARIPHDLGGAVSDSLGLKIGGGDLGNAFNQIEGAYRASQGSAENAARLLEQSSAGAITGEQLAGLARSGVLDGFVSSEDLLRDMARSGAKKTLANIADWPGRLFRGVEDRMRAGMWLDLVRKDIPADEAAQIVKDSLYDYSVSSVGNRTARDLVPFFQFPAKAIPQQIKLLNEKPWLAVGLSSLLTEKEGQPTYPYMAGKLNIPLGPNEAGGTDYVSGLGLPFEALTQIPNLSGSLQESGREIGRTLVSSSQPALKSIGTLAFGQDPYFGTKAGSYSKLPGNIEGGEAGRIYNILAGTGLIAPVSEPLRLIGKLADDRRSLGVRALDTLTGANVVSVDPDQALRQRLTEYLRANPDIGSVESLYSRTGDPEARAILKQLAEAKKRIKQKRTDAGHAPVSP